MIHQILATALTVLSVTAVIVPQSPQTNETTTQGIEIAPTVETKQEEAIKTKEEIVADVTDKTEKTPKYTLRV